jgi:hypothetical protein
MKEEQEMSEEQVKSFPLSNEYELIHIDIKTELEREGIELQRFGIDGPETIDRIVVTTDKEVPEEVKSRLREITADKGINVKFLTSDEVSGVG